jgi:hypothetical protein
MFACTISAGVETVGGDVKGMKTLYKISALWGIRDDVRGMGA